MPKFEGVYESAKGNWYFKVTLGRDPLSGKRIQITKRGFASASLAAKARREFLEDESSDFIRSSTASLTINELLDTYLDGIDADQSLARKTRFDYRKNADAYVRPWLGNKRVRDVSPEMIVKWQRKLADSGGTKNGKALSANTIRLARAPLANAYKMAISHQLVSASPMSAIPQPKKRKKIPRHWSPE